MEGEEIGGWARQHHEWLFETVSGAGGWKGKEAKPKAKSSRFTKDNTEMAGRSFYKKLKIFGKLVCYGLPFEPVGDGKSWKRYGKEKKAMVKTKKSVNGCKNM